MQRDSEDRRCGETGDIGDRRDRETVRQLILKRWGNRGIEDIEEID
jgi:hypothetical protein